MVGGEHDDLVGRSATLLFDPADRPEVRRTLGMLARGERREVTIERQLVRTDGSRVWTATRAVATQDAHVVMDVVESGERQAVELLDTIVSATPDLLLVSTPQGQVVRANASWERLLGWSEADLRGMDITALIHPDDVAASTATAEAVTTGSGPVEGLRNRYRTRDGDYRWLQWNGAELPGQGLVVGIARDVTGAVAVDDALRRSEEQARAAFDASPLGMAIADEHGRFIRVNAAYGTMLGRAPAELLGRSYRDFTHPDDLDTGDRQRSDKRQLRPDGTVVWARLGLVAIDGPDGAAHTLVQAEDVTAAVRAQARAARYTSRLQTTIAVQREVTAAAADHEAVLRLMAERALQVITGGNAAIVGLVDPGGTALQIAAGTGALAGERVRIPLDGSLGGLAVRTATTLRCDDIRTDPRVSTAQRVVAGVRSVIVAPLLGGDGPLGVLTVVSPAPGAFDDADEQQLTLLADALTGALRHADDVARNRGLLQEATDANEHLAAQRGEALAALERLAYSERRFAEVFDHGPVAKVVVGLRGADRGRITLANPAFTRLLGYNADESVTLTVGDLLAGSPVAMEQALDALAAGREGRTVRQSVLHHRDGHRVDVAGHTSVITDADGPVSAVLQMLDVTAERAAAHATEREFQRLRDTLLVQREVTAAAADRDSAVSVVAERAVQVFPAADGAVVELLADDVLYYAATAGTLAPALGTRVPVVGSLSGAVLATGAPASCADTGDDPRVNRETCARLGIGSMLIAPLSAGDTVIGALKVSAVRPRVFDDTDEQQLALLADSLSSALRHADAAADSAAMLAERTRALTALELSETRFKLAFDNSPLGLVLASLEPGQVGRYLHANPAMSAITGYSTGELTSMTFRDLQHPDDLASTDGLVRQLFAGEGDTLTVERRYRHKDGHTIWATVHVALVRENGRPRFLVNQVEDITQRRAELAQLHRQAALLQLIPAAVIVRTLDGRILWWNQGAEDLYGWPLADATGKVTHQLLSTGFPDGGTSADQTRVLQRDDRWEGQLKHATSHGRTVTVLSRQVLQGAGPAGTVLEVNTDVTEERAAKDALAASEARFRGQFHNSAVGQIVRNLDGSLAEVNAAYAAMLGYAPSQLTGTSSMHKLHPEDLPAAAAAIRDLLTGYATAFTLEARLRHARGHWVDTEATITLVRDPGGRPDHFIGVVTDASRRRAAERARDAAAAELADRNTELEDANRLKFDLIGMLGHEIGNPLAAILGYTEIFLDDWTTLDDARKTKIIEGIARQAHRLDDIVQEVLTMVRIDAGAIHAHREPVHLYDQITEALIATGTDIPVHGPSCGAMINPGHLQHILTNLISNAGKYAGGATAVRVADLGGRVQVRVEDRGPGVPEDFRDRLFQRLTRADRDAARVKGTGLGLYIVHSLAHANGGDVHHEPAPTGGSVFVVTLDAAAPPGTQS
ncbi:PAS domain S-box protein [Dactylosporangium sp. NPDC005555]|uniref:PAS domain S-box protein n=1 Tax=Dactylosporangium sp. NPDC005555 TaxID=3154889 RepID=UPI0033ADA269